MYTNDLISDSLTRIRNAIMRRKIEVEVPASKMVKSIMDILQSEGFIEGYVEQEEGIRKSLLVTLRYVDGEAVIRELTRVSRPGIRRYMGYRDIKKIKNGQGVVILTTPQGIMTGSQARAAKLGGETLCQIW